ncbi:hypothetical protein [Comamonas terrae]|uniref:Uncharacterized protein n=1 Tax=Comamonas terrae TaxID=673548 RepID=A0ABW5URZ6_9BURK|nr:hypothetical protein [Comamonas terrae]
MASVDLVFSLPYKSGNPVALVFGDDGGLPGVPDAHLVVFARMPGLRGRVAAHVGKGMAASARMPGLRSASTIRYNTNTPRPMVARVQSVAQQAAAVETGWAAGWQNSAKLPVGWTTGAQDARPLRSHTAMAWQEAQHRGRAVDAVYQQAQRSAAPAQRMRWQEGARARMALQAHAEDAMRTRASLAVRFEETLRDRRALVRVDARRAMGLHIGLCSGAGPALPLHLAQRVRYQKARRPPAGRSALTPPRPPDPEHCYRQHVGGPIELVLCKPWAPAADLLFACCKADGTPARFVIPVLPVYMQIHHLTAHLLPGMEPVALTDVVIAADDDSYCWSLSAQGPEHLLDQLAPAGALPQRLQIGIDGISFVFAVTGLARSRTFERRSVAVQGISVTAMLGAPYMPRQTWLAEAPATAQQLALAALEFTGVGLDWQIADWLLPAGAWSFQGTPLQAVLRLAESVNAVVRSHRTAEQLVVAPRYAHLPWEWGTAVPDVQMPAAVIVTDELRPDPRAEYNAVYVAGGSVGGVLGHVVRAGSGRDRLAPQIQDDLITHADAARMRGGWALAASGNKLQHTIGMPVLTGGTNPGILNPGQLLEVADTGGTWRGLVRGVSVSASMPRVRQQLVVERTAA